MSVLLIDIGNTRMKWVVLDNINAPIEDVRWRATGCSEDELNALVAELLFVLSESSALTAVYAVSVAKPVWQERWNHWMQLSQVPVYWIEPQAACGPLQNLYDKPASLGVDRWVMALAAAHHFVGKPCIVVGAGTATTIDAVSSKGEFLGGCILPGQALMLKALNQNTARLPADVAEPVTWPRNTAQAMSTGALVALNGAIDIMRQRLERLEQQPVHVILAGGDAQPLLAGVPAAQLSPYWVLEGIRVWALTQTC